MLIIVLRLSVKELKYKEVSLEEFIEIHERKHVQYYTFQ